MTVQIILCLSIGAVAQVSVVGKGWLTFRGGPKPPPPPPPPPKKKPQKKEEEKKKNNSFTLFFFQIIYLVKMGWGENAG